MEIRVIGDEIHCDGVLVAILAENANATQMAAFVDVVQFGDDSDADTVAGALTKLRKNAEAQAHGGLLKLTDLFTIIDQLKDD